MSSFIEETKCLLPRITLIACGCFSPPTPMHMRLFEIARDHFEMAGTHKVIGGIISPTHDSYGKKGLAPALDRCAMVKLALQSSNWIHLSDWEVRQSQWTRTTSVLQFHQNYINNFMNLTSARPKDEKLIHEWLPLAIGDRKDPVNVKLLCGADLLESFAVPGLWAESDIENIVANHGLVVITRSGSNPEKFIFESDILTKYQRNITLITNWVPNEVSSSMVRRLLGRGQSVKYLLDDLVLEYIKRHRLYNITWRYTITLRPITITPPLVDHIDQIAHPATFYFVSQTAGRMFRLRAMPTFPPQLQHDELVITIIRRSSSNSNSKSRTRTKCIVTISHIKHFVCSGVYLWSVSQCN